MLVERQLPRELEAGDSVGRVFGEFVLEDGNGSGLIAGIGQLGGDGARFFRSGDAGLRRGKRAERDQKCSSNRGEDSTHALCRSVTPNRSALTPV
jgi:hypothetical protein